ncbi:MAG: DUF1707 domain-containing protein [Acidimicrobiales bacterium]
MAEDQDESSPHLPNPALSGSAVTDEDRNRYGLLLDRAAERGLIGPYDYEVRLADLAAASTIEQMNRIVTELPAFAPAAATPSVPRASATAGLGRPGSGPTGASRRRSSPWMLLVIVVAVVAASLMLLTIYAEHTVRSRNSGLAPSVPAVRTVSALRL